MGVNVDVTVFKLNNVYPSAVQHAVEASQHLRLEAFYVYFEEVNVFNSLRGAVAISGSHRYRAGFWMVIMEGFGEICNAHPSITSHTFHTRAPAADVCRRQTQKHRG